MNFAPLAAKDIRGLYTGGYMQVVYPILLNMQSHSRKTTGTVTPFDKYAESQSRDCCAVTVTNFVKYAEAQSQTDCYAAPLVHNNLRINI